jgi:hypothetical protein
LGRMTPRVTAIIAAHNEADVIASVVGDLVDQGIRVHLLDHRSTDRTIDEALRRDPGGLVRVERFPEESGFPEEEAGRFALASLMRRKEQLASTLESDWFINADADEFREGPWPGRNLVEGIAAVDSLGFNAIDFALLDFWPTHDRFKPGDDVRKAFTRFAWGQELNRRQVRCWKRQQAPVHLQESAGHNVEFEGRRIFPLRFLLRHYPLRGQAHAERKIFSERLPRFAPEERTRGWHIQYEGLARDSLLRDPAALEEFDPERVRLELVDQRSPRTFALLADLDTVRAERDGARAIVVRSEREIEELCIRAELLESQLREALEAKAALEDALTSERSSSRELSAELKRVRAELASRKRFLEEVLASRSWRWMAPLRATLKMVRGR